MLSTAAGSIQVAFTIFVMRTSSFTAWNMHIKSPCVFLIFCTIHGKISKQGGVILKKLVVVLIAVLCVLGMISVKERENEKNLQEIKVMSPIRKNIVETVTLYGTVKEEGRESIYAKGTAMIERVYVAVGDVVKAGDPLMSFRPFNDAALKTLHYSDAETWAEQLYRDGITDSQHVYQEVQTVFNRIIIANNYGFSENSGEAYTLYSPIDGMVVSISGKKGDGVTEYFPAVIVTDLNQLSVQANVSEAVLQEIDLGDACNITVSALGSQTYTGEITFISPYAHETELLSGGGTYVTEVIVDINHNGTFLKPGYQAAVKVNVGEQKNAMMIPYDAVAQDDDGAEYVMIWTGKQAYRQNIVTGKEVDDFVQVITGVSEKQQIIRNVNQINFTESMVLYEAP